MGDKATLKLEPMDPANLDLLKPTDLSGTAYDYRNELMQSAELSIKNEDPGKMYICHLCDFRTAFRNSLLNHQAVHSDYRPWICAMCDYAAKRKQDLKKHLHTIHGLMVESTMLKPVDIPGMNSNVTPTSKSLLRRESSEENSWDGTKLNKVSEMDSSNSGSQFFHPSVDALKAGPYELNNRGVKEEKSEGPATSSSQGALPGMSNFVHQSSPDSPDYDLPISFPPASVAKHTSSHSHPQQDARSTASPEHLPETAHSSAVEGNNSDHDGTVTHKKPMHEYKFLPQNLPASGPSSVQHRKRQHMYINDPAQSDFPAARDQLGTAPSKFRKIAESEDTPCSSSVSISHARGSQTQTSFLCEHCDIMFFQRAMYLMHVGLHSPDNPWSCAVCGSTFTEKYSFTSHFINQH